MAFRATGYRIGVIRDTCNLSKPSCCVLCRNAQTVSNSGEKKELKERHEQLGHNKLKDTSAIQEKANVAVVGSDEQTVAQWSYLRDTLAGLQASVGNLSLSWKNDAGASNKSKEKVKLDEFATAGMEETKEEVTNEAAEVNNQASKERVDEQSEHVSKNNEEDESILPVNEKWVEQILEIQKERSEELGESDETVKTENVKKPVQEKLDDPLAETNTQPITKQKDHPTAPGITKRMSFSYFSKANKSANASPTISKSVSQPSVETKDDQSVAKSASTIDWIRDAVGLSASKKTCDTAGDRDLSEDTLKATIEDTIEKEVLSKPTNGADTDRSYWNVLSGLQQSILVSLSLSSAPKTTVETAEQIARNVMHSELESESGFRHRTICLSDNLVAAQSTMSKTKRLEDFCSHLIQHPQFRHIAVKKNVIPCLLKMKGSGDPTLIAKANEALALVGYIPPPQGRGIKMLSIDGGGTRGLIAIEILQRLERHFNQPVHQMFDFVIGSSTGALLAALIFLMKVPLSDCKELYLDRSAKMFVKESLLKKTRNMALHDVSIFEEVVRNEVGESNLIDTARDPTAPKMAITATLANIPKWKTFMFRNYNHQPGVISDYQGSCNIKIWEAIRASGSAPIYYSPFQIGDHIFRDGGLLVNNPTAAGIHECKLLWPNESFQCVLSLGNGKYDPNLDKQKPKGYRVIPRAMKDLADGFIDSATETEGVHMILKNTWNSGSYFRLSPYLKENYDLSEVQPEKIKTMLNETDEYMAKNELLMQKVVAKLKQDRLPNQRIIDFASQRSVTHDYLIFKQGRFKSHGHVH